ncbi:MAG: radical SAM protein, partial [Candidatus Omnitrophota bacterium]
MLDIAKLAKQDGLYVGMHSCGYINPVPLAELLEYMDFVNIDLKSYSEDFYNHMCQGAQLEPVLEVLKAIKKKGVHLEITALIIPGKNDDALLIAKMCKWINDNLGADVPLHISRFFPQYQLKNIPPTPIETLKNVYKIARENGLKYVYIGNLPGIAQESTFCPNCNKIVIKRAGYSILENNLVEGRCKFCQEEISGVWEK